ncbi:hypothetical protein [Comamonas thiooxydans]|uniref:hypothetical protein n=1 Tax=Comamonas thiooxydans TaxID=363952 RepID=UPI000B40AB6E|nr:hypothetical protein [Comamonas thiooxydans]
MNPTQLSLFRAVPASKIKPGEKLYGQVTKRFPSNIPYVVDNILEWLRPENMPCRRHAIYASPTPELALANASSHLEVGDSYRACLLSFEGPGLKVAQLQVTDARIHRDVRAIQKLALDAFDEILQGQQSAAKSMIGPLFLPGTTKEELDALYRHSDEIASLLERCRHISRFWQEASTAISPANPGELFFELQDESTSYSLTPI